MITLTLSDCYVRQHKVLLLKLLKLSTQSALADQNARLHHQPLIAVLVFQKGSRTNPVSSIGVVLKVVMWVTMSKKCGYKYALNPACCFSLNFPIHLGKERLNFFSQRSFIFFLLLQPILGYKSRTREVLLCVDVFNNTTFKLFILCSGKWEQGTPEGEFSIFSKNILNDEALHILNHNKPEAKAFKLLPCQHLNLDIG